MDLALRLIVIGSPPEAFVAWFGVNKNRRFLADFVYRLPTVWSKEIVPAIKRLPETKPRQILIICRGSMIN
jgi:hypothetical protein